MRRRLILSVLLGVLLLPRGAHLSQIHYQIISLKELMERSEFVLVVKLAKPSQRQIQVPIGKDRRNQEAPAFVRVQTRCEVLRALAPAGTTGAELVGKTLEIDGANWQETLAMHKIYYLEGIGESPIYDRYEPADRAGAQTQEPEPKDAPFIVFLRREGKSGFAFAAEGAVERLKNRAAIEELLRHRKQAPTP